MKKIVTGLIALTVIAILVEVAVANAKKIGNSQGYEPDQPIAFSHKTHAGENKIDCRYCHFASERGRMAGIPPTQLCFNCHDQIAKNSPEIVKLREAIASNKPIEWVRVHELQRLSTSIIVSMREVESDASNAMGPSNR